VVPQVHQQEKPQGQEISGGGQNQTQNQENPGGQNQGGTPGIHIPDHLQYTDEDLLGWLLGVAIISGTGIGVAIVMQFFILCVARDETDRRFYDLVAGIIFLVLGIFYLYYYIRGWMIISDSPECKVEMRHVWNLILAQLIVPLVEFGLCIAGCCLFTCAAVAAYKGGSGASGGTGTHGYGARDEFRVISFGVENGKYQELTTV
jgi:hypothetical protein